MGGFDPPLHTHRTTFAPRHATCRTDCSYVSVEYFLNVQGAKTPCPLCETLSLESMESTFLPSAFDGCFRVIATLYFFFPLYWRFVPFHWLEHVCNVLIIESLHAACIKLLCRWQRCHEVTKSLSLEVVLRCSSQLEGIMCWRTKYGQVPTYFLQIRVGTRHLFIVRKRIHKHYFKKKHMPLKTETLFFGEHLRSWNIATRAIIHRRWLVTGDV